MCTLFCFCFFPCKMQWKRMDVSTVLQVSAKSWWVTSVTVRRQEVFLKKLRRNSIDHHIPLYQNAKQDGVPDRWWSAAKGDSSLNLKDAVELNNYLLIPSIDKKEGPLAWWHTQSKFSMTRHAYSQVYMHSCYKLPLRETFQCKWQHRHLPTFFSQACNGG